MTTENDTNASDVSRSIDGLVSRTLLFRLGYQKGENCYYKTRRNKIRRQNKVTVQVSFYGRCFDLSAKETGYPADTSEGGSTLEHLLDWERYAFCG